MLAVSTYLHELPKSTNNAAQFPFTRTAVVDLVIRCAHLFLGLAWSLCISDSSKTVVNQCTRGPVNRKV
jgi:hypothetical protein